MCPRGRMVLWLVGLTLVELCVCSVGGDRICSNLGFRETGLEPLGNATNVTGTPRNVLFCCLGYNPNGSAEHFVQVESEEQCEPFCHPACPENSRCVPPNTCECVSYREFDVKQLEVRNCECNPGYILTAPEKCVPICPDFCNNGVCVNKQCICNKGYTAYGRGLCAPLCNAGCRQGEECTAPNVCTRKTFCVDERYERNSSGHCVPKCTNCIDDSCICASTEKCVTGFALDSMSNRCEALCDNCENGFCSAPDVCACNPGFQAVDGVCAACPSRGCNNGNISAHSQWLITGVHLGGVLILVGLIVFVSKCCAKRKKKEKQICERKERHHGGPDRFQYRVDKHREGKKLRPPCPLPRPRDSGQDSFQAENAEYVEVVEERIETMQKTDGEIFTMTIPKPEPYYEEIQHTNANLPSYELPYDPLALCHRRSPGRGLARKTIAEVPLEEKVDESGLDQDGYLEPQVRNIYVTSN